MAWSEHVFAFCKNCPTVLVTIVENWDTLYKNQIALPVVITKIGDDPTIFLLLVIIVDMGCKFVIMVF